MGVSWYPCKTTQYVVIHTLLTATVLRPTDCVLCAALHIVIIVRVHTFKSRCVYCNGSEIRPENLLE